MKNLKKCINMLPRDQIKALLENNGMAVYDSEPTKDLEEALCQCVEDGDFEEEDIRCLVE
jgi:hypothetical protein